MTRRFLALLLCLMLVLPAAVMIAGYEGILVSQFAADLLSAGLALALYAAIRNRPEQPAGGVPTEPSP